MADKQPAMMETGLGMAKNKRGPMFGTFGVKIALAFSNNIH
jgi:hypothetical protein